MSEVEPNSQSFGVFEDDTIVAISTPPGRGGIGIVRLSGARACSIAESLLELRRPLAAGRARFAKVIDRSTGAVLDEAVVTYFAAPNSYTSEDVVEIAAHGSPALLEYLVRACCAAGARLAEAGEFTQRAFLHGRIDLTQAEAVDDLIQSQTMEQARVAARQLGGAVSREVAPVKERLIELIAALEAGIDFAEDDIDVMPAKEIQRRLTEVLGPLTALEKSFGYGRVVREGFSLAIVGRPNAGKSSLFNRLVERDRAIVTAMPGTTRDTVAERVSLEGVPVEVIDTAGLRGSDESDEGNESGETNKTNPLDEAERMGMARSREAMADADIVLVVVDATRGLREQDAALAKELEGRPHLIVLNKADLLTEAPSETHEGARRTTSALTGAGIAELRKAILGLVSDGAVDTSRAMLTNVRQQQAVSSATHGLNRASAAVQNNVPHEMVLLDLYECLQALDGLTGVTTSEDILRLIFSKFCIGK